MKMLLFTCCAFVAVDGLVGVFFSACFANKRKMQESELLFSARLGWRHKPRQSGLLLSGQWLSTPRSDRECEWDETEAGWKTRRADKTQGLACVIGWVRLLGKGYKISLYCNKQRGDLQKRSLLLKGKERCSQPAKICRLLQIYTHAHTYTQVKGAVWKNLTTFNTFSTECEW